MALCDSLEHTKLLPVVPRTAKDCMPSPVTKQLKIRRPNLAEPLAQLSASLKKFIIIYAFDMLIL